MFLIYFQSLLVFWNISAQNAVNMSFVPVEFHGDIPSSLSMLLTLLVVRAFLSFVTCHYVLLLLLLL